MLLMCLPGVDIETWVPHMGPLPKVMIGRLGDFFLAVADRENAPQRGMSRASEELAAVQPHYDHE